jgi:hypothetical protein
MAGCETPQLGDYSNIPQSHIRTAFAKQERDIHATTSIVVLEVKVIGAVEQVGVKQ